MGQWLSRLLPSTKESESLIGRQNMTEMLLHNLEETNSNYLSRLETLQRSVDEAFMALNERLERIEGLLETSLLNTNQTTDNSNTQTITAPTEEPEAPGDAVALSSDLASTNGTASCSSDQINAVLVSTVTAAVPGSNYMATDSDDWPIVDTSSQTAYDSDYRTRQKPFVTEKNPQPPYIKHVEIEDLQKIGEGNGCTVFRGKHERLGVVAYKQLGSCSVIQAESKLSRKLRHEVRAHFLHHGNIVETLGMVFECGHHGILLEYVRFGNLDDFLHKYCTIGWFMLMSFAHDVACGLEHLHSMTPPAIHGDIKLKNVLIGEGLVAKIGDFGLSKWNELTTKYSPSAVPLSVTTTHFPPERWLNINAPRTAKCDVYGYAVLLWETFSRATPFSEIAGKPNEIRSAVTTGRRPPIDAIRGNPDHLMPDSMFELAKPRIVQCWSTEADKRPQITDVRQEFDRFLTANIAELQREKNELEIATTQHV